MFPVKIHILGPIVIVNSLLGIVKKIYIVYLKN